VYWGCFTKSGFNAQEQVTSAADVRLPTVSTPIILAGVGFESYASQLPEVVQSKIVKQCSVFPKASAMIRIVQDGQMEMVNALEALPVYVRNQVTQGEKSSG